MLKNLFFSIYLCVLGSALPFSFENYLKKAENKPSNCCCDFVDFVYVINLDERPNKFAFVLSQLSKEGVMPYRFSAVNGWQLKLEDLQKFGIEYQEGWRTDIWGSYFVDSGRKGIQSVRRKIDKPGRYLCHRMTRGAVGIILSHLSVIKDAYDSNYQRVWIMEDDILVKQPIDQLAKLVKEADSTLSNGWDVLYTDLDTYDNITKKRVECFSIAPRPDIELSEDAVKKLVTRTPLSENLIKFGNRYGIYSYIINRRGMKKILDHIAKYGFYLPFDMEFIYIPNFVQLASSRDLITTLIDADTDNYAPNYVYEQCE